MPIEVQQPGDVAPSGDANGLTRVAGGNTPPKPRQVGVSMQAIYPASIDAHAMEASAPAEMSDAEIIELIGAGSSEPLEYLLLTALPRVSQAIGNRKYALEFLKDACLFVRESIVKKQLDLRGRTLQDVLFTLCKERWDRVENEIRLDEKLYASLQSNDGWAYYYMQKKFFPQVEKMVLANSGTAEDAKDLIMDGIYILLKNINDGRYNVQTGARLKTYFVRICRNRWLDELKRLKKKMPASLIYDLEVEQTEAYYYEAYQDEELNDRQKAVKEQFMKGSDTCQTILRLYYYDNLSHKEIAARMQYNSEEVSRTQKKKCFEKLRLSVMKNLKDLLQS